MSSRSPAFFYEKIDTISNQFTSTLDAFASSYMNYSKNPEYNEYAQIYANNKGNIQSLNAELFVTTNDLQSNIDNLINVISNLNSKITVEKTKHTQLQTTLAQLEGRGNSSSVLIDNSKELYKVQYISNITIVLGIFFTLWLLFYIFTTPKKI